MQTEAKKKANMLGEGSGGLNRLIFFMNSNFDMFNSTGFCSEFRKDDRRIEIKGVSYTERKRRQKLKIKIKN